MVAFELWRNDRNVIEDVNHFQWKGRIIRKQAKKKRNEWHVLEIHFFIANRRTQRKWPITYRFSLVYNLKKKKYYYCFFTVIQISNWKPSHTHIVDWCLLNVKKPFNYGYIIKNIETCHKYNWKKLLYSQLIFCKFDLRTLARNSK